MGMTYLGGLLHHAPAGTLLSNPTINAYRRFRANSLAPDRVAWGTDHRGVMLRVLGAMNDPASRIENRVGEPSANPYLYIASQLIAGLNGIESKIDPGPPDTIPTTRSTQCCRGPYPMRCSSSRKTRSSATDLGKFSSATTRGSNELNSKGLRHS
jgi:glutamine synthetase